jgi:FixJ family two-component response regulator
MGTPTCHTTKAKVGRIAGAVPFVFIVDDDISVRESLEFLVEESGWRSEVFGSALEFLARQRPDCPSCLILDVGLPDVDGLELQRRIAGSYGEMPIIFLTGRADVGTSVRALKAGAVEFLTKPFSPRALRDAMRDALERSRVFLEEKESQAALRDLYQSLSPREREVMGLVVRGHLNKQVASALGISEITVKSHRGRVMRKMGARSLPELVISAIRLGLDCAQQSVGRNALGCAVTDSQFCCHVHQVDQSSRLHFLHDSSAMRFDRRLADIECAGDLPIHQPLHDESHDLSLALAQRLKPVL